MFPQTPHIECVAVLDAMMAATIDDGEVVPREHPDPRPGAGEVLVRVRAAGLNGADMAQLRGALPGAARLARGHPRHGAGRRGRRARARRDRASRSATA